MKKYLFKKRKIFTGVEFSMGMYSDEFIKKGEVLYDFSHLVPTKKNETHSFQVGNKAYIKDPDFVSNVNHSCRPNIKVDVSTKKCISLIDIPPGKVITYFYPSTEFQMVTPFSCLCGERNCLKTISGIKTLDQETINKHFINSFLLEILKVERP